MSNLREFVLRDYWGQEFSKTEDLDWSLEELRNAFGLTELNNLLSEKILIPTNNGQVGLCVDVPGTTGYFLYWTLLNRQLGSFEDLLAEVGPELFSEKTLRKYWQFAVDLEKAFVFALEKSAA